MSFRMFSYFCQLSGMVRLLDTFCEKNNLKTPVNHRYDLDDRIIFHRWLKKLKYVDQQYKKEGLGLEIAKLTNNNHLGVSVYIAAACPNLKSYVQLPRQYISIWYDYVYKDVHFNEHDLVVSWAKPAYYAAGLHVKETAISEELQVAIIYKRLSAFIGESDKVFTHVELAIPKPKNVKLYEEYFDCPVTFNAERTSFKIPKQILEMPWVTEDAMLLHILKEPAETIFNKMPKHTAFLENVNQAIIKSINAHDPKVNIVAGYLNMSTRVLQITLKEHNIRFQDLLTAVRFTLAKQYLLDGKTNILEIAILLGYQEQTSFNRAFKSWTSYSPMRWRDLYLKNIENRDDGLIE